MLQALPQGSNVSTAVAVAPKEATGGTTGRGLAVGLGLAVGRTVTVTVTADEAGLTEVVVVGVSEGITRIVSEGESIGMTVSAGEVATPGGVSTTRTHPARLMATRTVAATVANLRTAFPYACSS